MIVKPILNNIDTFDAKKGCPVNFVSNFGDQVIANEIEIYKLSDNTLIYTNKVHTFFLGQDIPADKLTNGMAYKIHLRTYNSSNQYSDWCDWSVINCYSTPIIDISNVVDKGELNNQTYTFIGSYSQAENDSLQCYRFILSDSNNDEIANSGLIFNNTLQYQFTALENNKVYNITLQATTQHNMTVSISKSFKPNYIQPTFSNLITLTNNPKEANVNLDIIAIRILGHIESGEVSIEDKEWVNTLNGKLYFDKENGFEIPTGDWSLQLWCKGLVDEKYTINQSLEGKVIVTLCGQNNVIFKIEYYDGRFHLYKFIKGVLFSHYVSNVINAKNTDVTYLFCQSINDRVSLKCEIIN